MFREQSEKVRVFTDHSIKRVLSKNQMANIECVQILEKQIT